MSSQAICLNCGWKITDSGEIQWIPEDWYCVNSDCQLNYAFDYEFFEGVNNNLVIPLRRGIDNCGNRKT